MSGYGDPRGSNQVTRFLSRKVEVPVWCAVFLLVAGAMSLVSLISDHGWLGVLLAAASLTLGVWISWREDR